MQYIKADTNTEVLIGPVVAVGDGFTPVTTLSLSTADEAEIIKYGGATPLTVTSISANGFAAITGADGYYTLDITTGNSDTEGFLTVLINDDSLCLPVRVDFMVVNANVYDSLFAAATTDYLQVDTIQVSGTAQTANDNGADINAILTDTADMQPKIGTLTDLGSGATVADNLSDMAGATFSGSTDSLEALQAEHDATQSLLEGFSATGSATNVPPVLSPGGFTLTTGSEVNTEDATRALDGTRHELTDSAGTTDGYYIFDIGAFGLPTSVTFKSVVNGGNDTFGIYVNVGSSGTPSWSQRGSITGTGTATNVTYTFDLLETDVLTDDSTAVWIRVYGTGLTTSSFDTDQLYVSRTFSPQYSGYDNGQLWGDTTDGTAGTTPGFNGIASRPTNSLANAITLAAAVGLDRFHWSGDSSITFAESHTDEVWVSDGGTLALGGQDCSSSTFIGWNSVSGVSTMASGEAHFIECEMDNATVGNSHFKRTGFGGTLTLNAATDYFLVDCYSQVAGASAPVIDMGAAVGASNVSIRRWSGGITLNNLAAGDVVTLDGIFGTVTLNGADATVEIRGIAKAVTNNLTGSPTVNDDTLKTDIQEDWTDGGRLDAILDAILLDTAEIGAAGDGLTAIPWNAAWDAEVQSECTDALNAYDPPTNAEMEARTPTAAQLAYIVSNAADGLPVTFTGGTTTTAILGNVDGSAASSTNDVYNGRILVFNAGTLNQQVTDITDYDGATKTATITAVTTAVTSSHTANMK